MKVAIMQPYFMPYVGYFALIAKSDKFILFDTPQFIRHGWIERNKISKPNGESLYIKVPLEKHSRDTAILSVKINNFENWQGKILAQLIPYRKKAKNYSQIIILLNEIFSFKTESIVALNYFALQNICNYLEITTPISIWSELNIEIEEVDTPDEWALNICKALNAKSYYNPEGGLTFFNKDKYDNVGIDLKFMRMHTKQYAQFTNEFLPSLSIIDVLMFNSKEEIHKMLQDYELI
jgi:WbqC-like protein family